MTALTNPVTGHQVQTDDESAEFWKAAGYREAEQEKKAPAKRSTSSKSKK